MYLLPLASRVLHVETDVKTEIITAYCDLFQKQLTTSICVVVICNNSDLQRRMGILLDVKT